MGEIVNDVYFDGTQYTYVHQVTPSLDDNFVLNTAFEVAGFTGVAGWSFSRSPCSRRLRHRRRFSYQRYRPVELAGAVRLLEHLGWDALEPITFFFVSTRPPGIGDFNLIGREAGTAQSYAPVSAPIPEPGSIALIGSGLVGLYAAKRRRRRLGA